MTRSAYMTIEDLKVTAALAHLNLSDGELAAAFPAFEQMLGYFAAMQAADTDPALQGAGREDNIAGKAQRTSAYFRPDQGLENAGCIDSAALLDNAGARDGRFVVIPNVL
ncbi:MAG: aspartyl/glutamyl-tRNA amidotransferase subunit C [Treponema sp.]|jgi:aspartyl-tRNA(Asn)/glutamyl-tRNA(Gln) amidotransferase subunit C|nr:aspartyl/glutamyl-tRNA amidotransferase subunit C [Treponema sp.]